MDDTRIIDLYFKRSQDAVTQTDIKYGGYLNTLIYNILRNTSDTEEIKNDTYLGAWNAIPPTRPDNLKHFLAKIARNLSFNRLDYIMSGKRHAILTELDECIPDKKCETETELEAKELGEILNRFLETLDKSSCAVFLARYFYCLTYEEIAEKYGCSHRQAKYTVSKTRNKLKSFLEKRELI